MILSSLNQAIENQNQKQKIKGVEPTPAYSFINSHGFYKLDTYSKKQKSCVTIKYV